MVKAVGEWLPEILLNSFWCVIGRVSDEISIGVGELSKANRCYQHPNTTFNEALSRIMMDREEMSPCITCRNA